MIIHIFGHSWEIEANKDWQRLSSLLKELADRDNVTMLTNAELEEVNAERQFDSQRCAERKRTGDHGQQGQHSTRP